MRRFVVTILVCLLCFFGCSKEEGHLASAIEFRAKLVQAGGCSYTALITADYGDYIQSFRLSCDADVQGNVRFTLIEPETLSGISATVTEGGSRIDYDGLIVALEQLADDRLAPAAAPGIILESWLSGYIQWAGHDEEVYRVTYRQELNYVLFSIDTFFKNELPFSAEVCYNNERILEMKIEEFQYH